MEDRELLAAYAERADQAAFGELVRRHGGWVLAVCRRRLGDAAMAEDAAQGVFAALAKRAGKLARQSARSRLGEHWRLEGWLH